MKEYTVTIPVAGHAYVTVEAESEEEAKSKAFDVATQDDIEDIEFLDKFNSGNVCYCPSPWEVDVTEE